MNNLHIELKEESNNDVKNKSSSLCIFIDLLRNDFFLIREIRCDSFLYLWSDKKENENLGY